MSLTTRVFDAADSRHPPTGGTADGPGVPPSADGAVLRAVTTGVEATINAGRHVTVTSSSTHTLVVQAVVFATDGLNQL